MLIFTIALIGAIISAKLHYWAAEHLNGKK
jgi:hypothetical protein